MSLFLFLFRPGGRGIDQPYIPYQTSTSTPVKPQPIEHTVTSVATQRSLIPTNHSPSPNPTSYTTNVQSIFQPNNKYIEKDNYQVESKTKLSLPPEPERMRLKTHEKSLSNEKLFEKNARLRFSQEGLYDRNDRVHNERLCLSSERLNQSYNERNDDRKYKPSFVNEQNRNNLIDVDLTAKEKSLSSINVKNDQIKERSFRSQENLNLNFKYQQKNKKSPTFQEQKEKFLQEIKDKANGINEKHFKNVKNDSDKFQKSPILKDIKDKKLAATPRRTVASFGGTKNIPENFSPGPQLVPERDLNSIPLRNCEVDFFITSQFNSGNLGSKVEDFEGKHDEYFRLTRESTDSLYDLNKEDGKVKVEPDSCRSNNDNKCNRLDSKPDNLSRGRGEPLPENNYENVDLQISLRNSQTAENDREKALFLKKEQKIIPDKGFNSVKKDSSLEANEDESTIIVPSDFESGSQKNLVVKPLTSNLRIPNINNSRHSTRTNGKIHLDIRNGGASPEKCQIFADGSFQNRPRDVSPTKDVPSGKLNGSIVINKSGPQVNKQLKSWGGSKVVSSRQGNISNNNSGSRGQRLPHRHVSEEELRLLQVKNVILKLID